MKNWEKIQKVWNDTPFSLICEGEAWKAALRVVGVDPDAEWGEPAKPEAEYDAGWTWTFYSSQFPGYGALASDPRHKVTYPKAVAAVAAEAARREREKVASNTITLQNKVEAARVQLATCGAVARGAFCPSEGSLGWSDSLSAVQALRAERDELLWRNANQKRLLEQYQARLRERQPSADLAGIVERMQDLREKRVSDPDIWMLCNAVIDLAQAVAGMGGGK